MPDPSTVPTPYVVFLPYLPLADPTDVGTWVLSPLQDFEGPWLSPRFEHLSRRFIAAFRGKSNKPILSPTIVARSDKGCDGEPPTPAEMNALRQATVFAVLDQNPTWSEGNSSGSLQAAQALTTDNADLHVWPIDLAEGYVAHQSGFVVSTLAGGYRIEDDLPVTPPEELHIPFGSVSLDSEVATAIYNTIAGKCEFVTAQDAARVGRTIGWLAKAWRNTPSVGWQERIVFLKTGFEALTEDHTTPGAGRKLRRLFENVVSTAPGSADNLLWSPTDGAARSSHKGKKAESLTDLQQWFDAFGKARNRVIHGGAAPDLAYEKADSAYNGPMFQTATRLLREATKVELARLGHEGLYLPPTAREIGRHLERAAAESS